MRDTLIPVGILLAGLAIIVFLTTTSASRAPIPTEAEALPVAEAVRPVLDDYGLPVDLETVSARVPRNATFSDLIVPHGIAYERVVTLAASARPTFDVRRIQAGRPYRIYKVDSTQTARFLVYEPDRTSYVVFDLGDEGAVERVERPVETQVRTVEGTISSSLYVTLMEQDVHPELATRMSEVFAWQVDFYRIQP
ncbi:MAG: peptidase M23, partial [Bacteroidetes bacterium CG12_big_fil_rev_8_21_14_0_65_60_17]